MKRIFVLFILFIFVCPMAIVAQGFRYPMPPDSISDRQKRIGYMLEHFWNEQNLTDTTSFMTPDFLLDYLYLLKQRNDEEKEKYIQSFISLASNYDKTFGTLLWWLDNILYDSSSPYYDEEMYLSILNVVMSTDVDSIFKILPKERLKVLKKNRIGYSANDFSFIDKHGQKHRLYEINAPLLLLIFNNPDCSLCSQTEKDINNDKILRRLMMSDSLKILAITPIDEYDKWLKHSYPKNWYVGFDVDNEISSSRLYDIQRLPSIYLLDQNKRVLLKEADYERLCRYEEIKKL